MIQTSAEFQSAIVGSPRWVELSALVDFSDPDKEYLPVTSSPEAAWSRKEQLHNLILDSLIRLSAQICHSGGKPLAAWRRFRLV